MSKKLIRVSAGLEVTAHDFPQGTIRQQNKELCRLIGNGCDYIERVAPRRLYTELGHTREVKAKGSRQQMSGLMSGNVAERRGR